jgi:hypothetical protein
MLGYVQPQPQPSTPSPSNGQPQKKEGRESLIEVKQFDMTEEEVRIWDTRVGMAVGLFLLIATGSALVFGAIKLINWLNS